MSNSAVFFVALVHMLSCRGGDQADINYLHNSSQIQLFSFSHWYICLVAGMGGKLSRPVYLAPPPYQPEYQSKIMLRILLILNYIEYEDLSIYQL